MLLPLSAVWGRLDAGLRDLSVNLQAAQAAALEGTADRRDELAQAERRRLARLEAREAPRPMWGMSA